MFALDKTKVTLPRTGCLFLAPKGTPFPTSFTATPAAPWVPVGYLGSDGPSRSGSPSITELRGWQNNDVLARFVESHDVSWSIPTVETKKEILEAAWNTVITQTEEHGSYTIDLSVVSPEMAFSFWSVDKLTGARKMENWEGFMTPSAEQAMPGNDLLVLPLTISINSNIEIIDEKLKAAAAVV